MTPATRRWTLGWWYGEILSMSGKKLGCTNIAQFRKETGESGFLYNTRSCVGDSPVHTVAPWCLNDREDDDYLAQVASSTPCPGIAAGPPPCSRSRPCRWLPRSPGPAPAQARAAPTWCYSVLLDTNINSEWVWTNQAENYNACPIILLLILGIRRMKTPYRVSNLYGYLL